MWHKQSFTQFWSQSDAYSRRSSLKLTYIHHPLVVCTHQICCAVAVPIALSQDRLLHGHNRLVNWTPCSRMRESKLKTWYLSTIEHTQVRSIPPWLRRVREPYAWYLQCRMSHNEEQNMAPKKPDEFYSWRLMHFAHILQSNSKCWHWDNRKIPASYVDMQNQLMQCWIQTNMAILGASMNINAFMMIRMTSCNGKGFPISYHLGSHGLPDTKGQ